MTELHVLSDIPFYLDADDLSARLHIGPESNYANELRGQLAQALEIARPKAVYRIARVEAKSDKTVTIDGVELTSRVLRVNLEAAHRVFAYVATCGTELDEWSSTFQDMLQKFWADSIKEHVLYAALAFLQRHIDEVYQPGKTSSMSPGSLGDWPISQQRQLFKIVGDTIGAVGVRLTDSKLMLPTKSVSGLIFPTEAGFASCQLCSMPDCPNRRARYDPELFEKKYTYASQ